MAKVLHWFGAVAFVLALGGLGTVLVSDVINQLHRTRIHESAGALSFMLIGASHLSLLLNSRRRFREMLKEILLGTAFFLWGCEQFVPPGPLAAVMDTAVILIFVVDLSWIVLERLKARTMRARAERGKAHLARIWRRVPGVTVMAHRQNNRTELNLEAAPGFN